MQNFKNLEVRQKSHHLTLEVYHATAGYPSSEKFGLINQMRRASASIPANIAEGCGRGANAEFRQFLHIAAGSANELIYFLLLSKDLGFLVPKHFETLDKTANDVKQMLTRLIQSVEAALGRVPRASRGLRSDGER